MGAWVDDRQHAVVDALAVRGRATGDAMTPEDDATITALSVAPTSEPSVYRVAPCRRFAAPHGEAVDDLTSCARCRWSRNAHSDDVREGLWSTLAMAYMFKQYALRDRR